MNIPELRAEIARSGMTKKQIACLLGVSESTFWRKMQKGSFGIEEANMLIKILKLRNPERIFFAD